MSNKSGVYHHEGIVHPTPSFVKTSRVPYEGKVDEDFSFEIPLEKRLKLKQIFVNGSKENQPNVPGCMEISQPNISECMEKSQPYEEQKVLTKTRNRFFNRK